MDESTAIACLSALAQPTRLQAFRLLVEREPEGIAAGEIARLAGVPQNTMSTHLAALAHCGLVRSERKSRSIIYRADLACVRSLLTYLTQNCCGGRPEICAPLTNSLRQCEPPVGATSHKGEPK